MTHIPRPTSSRLSPVDHVASDVPPELAEVLAKTAIGNGEPLNIFRTMAHHPRLLKRFNATRWRGQRMARRSPAP